MARLLLVDDSEFPAQCMLCALFEPASATS